jgi:hypothetical protein
MKVDQFFLLLQDRNSGLSCKFQEIGQVANLILSTAAFLCVFETPQQFNHCLIWHMVNNHSIFFSRSFKSFLRTRRWEHPYNSKLSYMGTPPRLSNSVCLGRVWVFEFLLVPRLCAWCWSDDWLHMRQNQSIVVNSEQDSQVLAPTVMGWMYHYKKAICPFNIPTTWSKRAKEGPNDF